jgi:arylsulfatase A-like enzyme
MTALARDGIILANYYSMHICTPARASLLTGLLPIKTGMQHECIQANSPWGLPVETIILPQMLNLFGYSSHMIGKYDIGHNTPSAWPQERGFDSFVGLLCYGYIDYAQHLNEYRGLPVYDLHDGFANVVDAKNTYSTTYFGGRATQIIAAHDVSSPLFLYVAWNAVHNDVSISAEFETSDLFRMITVNVTDYTRSLLAGALYLVDNQTHTIMNALVDRGMYENSVVVVVSDNGGSPIDGGSNWPMRGAKRVRIKLHLNFNFIMRNN